MQYPFSPELLDALPEPLAELFRGLELKLLEEICGRLKAAGELNEVAIGDIRALRAHGIALEEIQKAIRETVGISDTKLTELFDDVVERNQAYYTELIDLAQVTAPPYLISESDIAAIRRQTWGAYKNITGSMGFLVVKNGRLTLLPPAETYQHILDGAVLQVQSGAISYNQAIAEAVRGLADKGLCVVEYESKDPNKRGRVDHIDVAVRRAVMTGVSQLNDRYDTQAMEQLNTRYCEISAHSGARDKLGSNPWSSHKAWQGKVYYESVNGEPDPLGKYPDLVESTGYGYVDGLKGANCRHRKHAFIPDVMERTYTDEYLEHIDDSLGCEFEGKTYSAYEATQKQREIERAIRHWKRRQAAEMDEEKRAAITARIRLLNQKYKDFSEAAGLPLQRERMQVLHT